uniref:Uncharacterized protein n=1 Tax=Globisporangium ultimum (strain ATCC 200006 / CBS 805.95 / DAOM BR144) TaxID=431595 RepID=K3WRK2_GLOUD
MAKIPMEEWMRTRESARTTVHVADDDGFEYETSEEGVRLGIDRSQTPDWAKTVKPKGAHKAERTSPSQIEARRLGAGEKWGKRAAPQPFARANANERQSDANHGDSIRQDQELDDRGEDVHDTEDPLYKNQQSSKMHQLEGAQQRPSAAPENVMSLSIANLDINSHKPSLTSSSLALEREQLEKRKKQIDTANAVAAMNNRLSQLGLLKLQTPQQVSAQEEGGSTNITQDSEQKVGDIASASDDASTHDESEELVPKVEATCHGSVEKDQKGRITRPDIPEEMLQSIDISVIRRVTEVPDELTSRIQDRLHEGTRSVGENTFDIPKPTVTDSVASLCAVDQSMSTFTQGFVVKNVQSTTSSIIGDVDRSLSAFSSGYTDGVASKTPAVSQPINVTSSLSAYTQGYMGEDETKESISRNTGVAESLSSFTTEYQAQNNGRRSQDSREPRVDESLNAFTSGFQVVSMADQSDKVMQRKDATSASMSLFTSGYSSEHASQEVQVNQSISLSSVTASLSQFTSGYNTDNSFTAKASTQSSTNNSRRQSATDSAVAASFSMFTIGYEADGCPITEQNATPAKETKIPAVMESLSVFTTGYEVDANQGESPQQSNSNVISGSNTSQQTKFEPGNNASDGSSSVGVGRSLSSFTAGYEVMNALPVSPASSPCSVVSSTSSSTPSHARETSEAKLSSADARCPEATVQATISDLDQQLVTVAKAFEDFLPTEKAAAPEVQEIQQLVTQLRAAIEKFSGSEN